MSAEYWREWRESFVPNPEIVQEHARIIRFDNTTDRGEFIYILNRGGLPEDRIVLLEHGGLEALSVDNLTEVEFYGVMQGFWRTCGSVKEAWQGPEVPKGVYEHWVWKMGIRVLELVSYKFRCGVGYSSIPKTLEGIQQIFERQCGPLPE